jgi:hypothetical protein
MQAQALQTAQAHSLDQERDSFLKILDRAAELWRS